MASSPSSLFNFLFQRKTTPITKPSGTTGVASYAGKIANFETSPDLQGRNLYTTYANMIANSVTVGAGVRYYQNLISGTSWTVTEKEGSGAIGKKAADLVRTGLFEANMASPWSTVVKRASMYRFTGFSAHEWTMRKRKDGAKVFDDIAHRPQQTIEYWDIPDDNNGYFIGVVQRPVVWGNAYYYIARNRLFYCVDNSLSDNPDGVGVLRHVVEHARRLKRYEQLEGWAYETDLRGIPVGRIPYRELEKYAAANGKDDAWIAKQVASVETMVENHVRSPYLGITLDSSPYTTTADSATPTISAIPQWSLDLLKGDAAGLSDITKVIERINREIARVLGMEFMMLGEKSGGSHALAADKTSMFASILEATLHEMTWFAVNDLVYPLLVQNNIDPELYCPDVNPDPIATERIETTVAALQALALAGAPLAPDDPAINQIRSRLHLADAMKMPPELVSGRPQRPGAGQQDGSQDAAYGGASVYTADDGSQLSVTPSGGMKTPGPRSTRSTFRQPAPKG